MALEEDVEELLEEHWKQNLKELFDRIEENKEKALEDFVPLEELD